MKYDIVIGLGEKHFRFKDVEAVNEEAAEIRCIKELKTRLKLVSIQPSPEVREPREPNARTMTGDEMFKQFFGKH